jgi:ankyrin repeat protein
MDIFQAIAAGNLERVRALIAQGTNVNARDGNRITPLGNAIFRNNLPIVQELITLGADVNARNNHGGTELITAVVTRRQLPIIRELITRGADVNARDNFGDTALIHAASRDQLPIIRELITRGADVNARNNNGGTALIHAAYRDHLPIIQELMTRGADVNIVNNRGETALLITRDPQIRAVLQGVMPAPPAPPVPPAPLVRIPEVLPDTTDPLHLRLLCPICKTNIVNTRLNPCGHLICSTCYPLLRNSIQNPRSCPMCNARPVTNDHIFFGGYYNKYQKYLNKLK